MNFLCLLPRAGTTLSVCHFPSWKLAWCQAQRRHDLLWKEHPRWDVMPDVPADPGLCRDFLCNVVVWCSSLANLDSPGLSHTEKNSCVLLKSWHLGLKKKKLPMKLLLTTMTLETLSTLLGNALNRVWSFSGKSPTISAWQSMSITLWSLATSSSTPGTLPSHTSKSPVPAIFLLASGPCTFCSLLPRVTPSPPLWIPCFFVPLGFPVYACHCWSSYKPSVTPPS